MQDFNLSDTIYYTWTYAYIKILQIQLLATDPIDLHMHVHQKTFPTALFVSPKLNIIPTACQVKNKYSYKSYSFNLYNKYQIPMKN